MSAVRALYPELPINRQTTLDVGDGHRLYVEESGNPDGVPVIGLHGGPAGQAAPAMRRFFDPARYRICLFDQRGAGRSRPHGETRANTTAHLVDDIERIRVALGVSRWLVFGGSWGSALALAYAGAHPHACTGLVLRGIFLTGWADMQWFFADAGQLVPDAWARFAAHVGADDAAGILRGYTAALHDDDATAREATANWLAWEAALSSPGRNPKPAAQSQPVSDEAVRKYRLQAAYLNRGCDLGDDAVLSAAAAARSAS